MKIFSKRNGESLAAYFKRIIILGRYRLWVSRLLTFFMKKPTSVHVCSHLLRLPMRSAGIVEELRLFGSHEPGATATYTSMLKPGMSVLEVGTNLGYYLAVADSQIGDSGKIIGIEPDPELFAVAVENAEQMAATVTVRELAVSDSNGTAAFYRSRISNWGSLHSNAALAQSEKISVRTITIDTLVEDNGIRPDAIRMDIEGHEGAALRGAEKTLRQYRPLLFIELHLFILTDSEVLSIIDLLESCGYEMFTVIDRYYDFPWAWKSARKENTAKLSIKEIRETISAASCPSVISLLSCDFSN